MPVDPEPTTSPAAPAAQPHAPRPHRRWLGVTLTLLLIVLMVGAAYWLVRRAGQPATPVGPGGPGGPPGAFGGPPGGAGAASVTVGAARALQGELPVVIDALGTVTPSVTATLVPQVSGVLTEVLFAEGQKVGKGQVLARIDARPYEQSLAQARGQLARDEAQLAAARLTLGRYQTLWQQDSIARQDVDTQTALVRQLEGVIEADRASERAARLNVDFTTIRAPINGIIGLRAVDPGNLVSTGTSSGIATITQVQPIDVVFSVPQDRVPAVLAAQRRGHLPVVALDRGRTQKLAEGQFLTLDNQINPATGTVRAKARFGNVDNALFPSQFVNARLQLGSESGVLVPVTAVRTGPRGDYVYVIEDGVAGMRAVTRGLATVDQIMIASGLKAGELVVTEGGDRVKDGGRVMVPGDAPAGARTGRRAAASAPVGAASGPPGERNRAASPAPAAPAVPASAAVAPAAATANGGSPPPWLERLPPEWREKVLAMSPEERRAFLEQLRARRQAASAAAR